MCAFIAQTKLMAEKGKIDNRPPTQMNKYTFRSICTHSLFICMYIGSESRRTWISATATILLGNCVYGLVSCWSSYWCFCVVFAFLLLPVSFYVNYYNGIADVDEAGSKNVWTCYALYSIYGDFCWIRKMWISVVLCWLAFGVMLFSFLFFFSFILFLVLLLVLFSLDLILFHFAWLGLLRVSFLFCP